MARDLLLRVSAPGKVILHGEHSVVYGKTALAVSVDLRTTVNLFRDTSINSEESAPETCLEIHMTDLKATYKFPVKRLKEVKFSASYRPHSDNTLLTDQCSTEERDKIILEQISNLISERYSDLDDGTVSGLVALLYLYLNIVVDIWSGDNDLEPLIIEINSQIPIGAGLGSSAAFAVTIAGAFYYYRRNIKSSIHQDLNNIIKSHTQDECIKHESKNTNLIEKLMPSLLDDISQDATREHTESSKSSSGCISTCSSSASLSPLSTPSPTKHFNHSSEDNESIEESDDEEFISIIDISNKCNTTKLDHDEVCKWAFLAEKVIHGNPSGIDNTICTYGGLLTYRNRQIVSVQTPPNKNKDPHAAPMIPLRILLINTKVPKNTKVQVGKVQKIVHLLPKTTEHILCAMDEVAIQSLDTMTKLSEANSKSSCGRKYNGGNKKEDNSFQMYQKLEELIDINQGLLKTLGVSHPSLDLVQALTAKQMLHSKLTGAGGGGFAFALVTPNHDDKQIQITKDELVKNGFECWEAQIGCIGLSLEECSVQTATLDGYHSRS